jgi:hypothetical protein
VGYIHIEDNASLPRQSGLHNRDKLSSLTSNNNAENDQSDPKQFECGDWLMEKDATAYDYQYKGETHKWIGMTELKACHCCHPG